MMNEKARLLMRMAEDHGAHGTAYLPAEKVILDAAFRDACRQNHCGRYGRCHMCPPDIGEIDALMRRVGQYAHAVVYQSVFPLEDSFDFEGMMAAGKAHSQLSQRVQREIHALLAGPYLHLSAGCRLCDRCAKMDDLPCRYPGEALAALEGWGVDVYQTIRNTSLRYVNGPDTVTYFGMILYTE